MSEALPVTCRVRISGRELECIERTTRAYASAVEFVTASGLDKGTSGNGRLHHLCYRAIREKYGLSANLAIRAIARAAATLKGEEADSRIVDYDARICRVSSDGETVSLTTLCGRIQIPLGFAASDCEVLAEGRLLRAQTLLKEGGDLEIYFVIAPQKGVMQSDRGSIARSER
jgi:putative transposase